MLRENQDLNKMLAIMAHDIKAPLSSIISLLNIIVKGYLDQDVKKSKEMVTRARDKATMLVKMLEDILDFTLIVNRSDIKREKVSLFKVVEESINLMRSYAEEMSISIHYDKTSLNGNDIVWGNPTFLLRVFNNIVMNAIKYNKTNGQINIIGKFNPSHDDIEILVKDTGVGMDKEDLEKIFFVLERGKYARKNVDGSIGLGMSLVREIINDHEGRIEVKSKLNGGTSVKVAFPRYTNNNVKKK